MKSRSQEKGEGGCLHTPESAQNSNFLRPHHRYSRIITDSLWRIHRPWLANNKSYDHGNRVNEVRNSKNTDDVSLVFSPQKSQSA